MQQERGIGEFGQRSIGQFLGERGRVEALEERRRAEKVALGEAERKTLATVRTQELKTAAARAKEERGRTEQKRREEVRAKAAAIPSPQTTQQIEKERLQIEKMQKDLDAIGGPAALTPTQKLSFDKQVLKSEEVVQSNMDEPAAGPHMDWLNKNSANPYMYIQREVPGTFYGTNFTGEQVQLPVTTIQGVPRQMTSQDILEIAASENMTPEEVLKALAILEE